MFSYNWEETSRTGLIQYLWFQSPGLSLSRLPSLSCPLSFFVKHNEMKTQVLAFLLCHGTSTLHPSDLRLPWPIPLSQQRALPSFSVIPQYFTPVYKGPCYILSCKIAPHIYVILAVLNCKILEG